MPYFGNLCTVTVIIKRKRVCEETAGSTASQITKRKRVCEETAEGTASQITKRKRVCEEMQEAQHPGILSESESARKCRKHSFIPTT